MSFEPRTSLPNPGGKTRVIACRFGIQVYERSLAHLGECLFVSGNADRRDAYSSGKTQVILPLRTSGRPGAPGGVPFRISSTRSALTRGLLAK